MSFSVENYSIEANKQKPIYIPAKFFLLVSTESNVNIRFIRNNTRFGNVEDVGEGFSYGPIQQRFDGIEIESVDGSAQTVKIALGDEPADYKRYAGEVSVTNLPEENYTTDARHFIAYMISSVNTGNFSIAQFYNPSTSGKLMVVDFMEMQTTETSFVYGAINTVPYGGSQQSTAVNCLSGEDDGNLVFSTIWSSTPPTMQKMFFAHRVTGEDAFSIIDKDRYSITLKPNHSIMVRTASMDESCYYKVAWREIDI